MILGVSGDVGSFSEEAALLYSKKRNQFTELKYLLDIEEVLIAVEDKKVDLGILPVVNLKGGLVKTAFKAMGKYSFEIIDELWLKVEQCLLITPKIKLIDIKKIVTHPQAIAQCQQYLKHHFPNIECVEWKNTAKAARDLSDGKLSTNTAVIGHKNAAFEYGLEIAAHSIQDDKLNLTAFIIVQGS
jgi:prephenate dehydratase